MTLIRRPLTGLLALFVGSLSIDRLALNGSGGRSIATATYLLALGFTTAPLVFRGMRRSRKTTFGLMAVGSAIGLLALSGRLSSDPYQALVETSFVALAGLLAHSLAKGLTDLDSALNSVVFGDSPALPLDGRQAANEILTEMARSRRHGRPLSVTVLAPDAASVEIAVDGAAEEVQRAVRARYVQTRVAQTIADQLRRSDLFFEDPATGHFVIISPETSGDGTRLLVDRVRQAVRPSSVRLEAGRATFPDDALTFEQLVEHAQEHMGRREASVPEHAGEGAV